MTAPNDRPSEQELTAAAAWRPSLERVVLAACACGHPHPNVCFPFDPRRGGPDSFKGCTHAFPVKPGKCPACGAPRPTPRGAPPPWGATPLVVVGWSPAAIWVRLCFAISSGLLGFAGLFKSKGRS